MIVRNAAYSSGAETTGNTPCLCPRHFRKDKNGYNRVKYDKKMQGLHRLVWYFCYGAIPEGVVVCHSCNNTGCVNPFHLYLATPEENSTHAARDGLYQSGREHVGSKLSKEQIQNAFKWYYIDYLSQREVAERLGCSQSALSKVLRGNSYKADTEELYERYKHER